MSAKRLVLVALMSAAMFVPMAQARDFTIRPPEFLGGTDKQRLVLEVATSRGFNVIETDEELLAKIRSGQLVRIQSNGTYYIDSELGIDTRRGEYKNRYMLFYLHPHTEEVLAEIAGRYHGRFSQKLKFTSLIRSGDYQRWLAQMNANARISLPSGHQTSLVADISKKGMSAEQLRWMRAELWERVQKGEIVVIEEMEQLAFHIFVVPKAQQPTIATLPPSDRSCTFN